ncbi:MAG: TraM recognition domain-containing protein [Betaproteobacteria bacterium]|nr:TraM recognition domain-containing protein [Betaproteobacteria bacterium]
MRMVWLMSIGLFASLVAAPIIPPPFTLGGFALAAIFMKVHRPGTGALGLTDVREIHRTLPRPRPHDPRRHFNLKKGVFVGIDASGRAVYLPWLRLRKSHVDLVGITGMGKSVAASILVAQCAMAGEAVCVFDPKDDQFMATALFNIAKDKGLPFRLLDLRPGAPAQLGLFEGAEANEIEELLVAGFDLTEKGDMADVYRLDDRRAAALTARYMAENRVLNARQAFAALAPERKKHKDARKFWADLEELTGLACIDTRTGYDLRRLLEDGGILYVLGSTRYARTVKLQKMLCLRLMQIVERRPRTPAPRHCAVFLDEIKYLLSAEVVRAFGTVRDKSCHIIAAHQSLGDLRDCGNLDPVAVEGAIGNAGIKCVYRVNSPETAQWGARLSGQVIIGRESFEPARSWLGRPRRTWSEAQRPYIDENMFLALPPMVGVWLGEGIAKTVSLAPLPAKGERPHPIPAEDAALGPEAFPDSI